MIRLSLGLSTAFDLLTATANFISYHIICTPPINTVNCVHNIGVLILKHYLGNRSYIDLYEPTYPNGYGIEKGCLFCWSAGGQTTACSTMPSDLHSLLWPISMFTLKLVIFLSIVQVCVGSMFTHTVCRICTHCFGRLVCLPEN